MHCFFKDYSKNTRLYITRAFCFNIKLINKIKLNKININMQSIMFKKKDSIYSRYITNLINFIILYREDIILSITIVRWGHNNCICFHEKLINIIVQTFTRCHPTAAIAYLIIGALIIYILSISALIIYISLYGKLLIV